MSASGIAFLVVIVAFLLISLHAARVNRSTDSHYVASRRVSGFQNGLAITGEFASAASFLGISGAIALSGYSGFYLAIGVPLSFMLLLLIVAEPMRRAGRFTVADMLASRFPETRVRAAVALVSIFVTALYMVAQFVGAGALLQLLFGIDYSLAVIAVGILMAFIVLAGGMIAATRIQVVKTVLLLGATALLFVLVLGRIGWNPLDVFSAARDTAGAQAVKPARPPTFSAQLDTLSLVLALSLGTAGLPHIMIRFLTVPSAAAARRSALIACSTMSVYLVGIVFIGYGASVLVGGDAIAKQNPSGTTAVPQLAAELGGDALEGVVSGISFAVIVAVLAGLVIAASGAVAHDLYSTILRRGAASDRTQLLVARVGALGVSVVAILLALGARTINLAFLGTQAFSVAASTTLPVVLFCLYWRRFSAAGAVWGVTVGGVSSLLALGLGPNVWGDGAPFPLGTPALMTVPLGFLGAVAGTLLTSRAERTAALGAVTESSTINPG